MIIFYMTVTLYTAELSTWRQTMKKSIIALSACLLVISIFVGYGHSRSSRNSSNNRDEREPSASIVVNPRDGSTSTYVRDGSGTGGSAAVIGIGLASCCLRSSLISQGIKGDMSAGG